MGIKVGRHHKAHVVGCHHRQTAFCRQCDRRMQIVFFFCPTGTDQFEIIAIREILLVEIQALTDLQIISAGQKLTDITHSRAGKQDQTFIEFCQPFEVDDRPGCAVTALICSGNQ
ncbi:hypothetical protein SRABI106_03957 [Rahnella aquatilis]|nr:hypothetical protein SRABI106_03957 [Rahnella aquatilis]